MESSIKREQRREILIGCNLFRQNGLCMRKKGELKKRDFTRKGDNSSITPVWGKSPPVNGKGEAIDIPERQIILREGAADHCLTMVRSLQRKQHWRDRLRALRK